MSEHPSRPEQYRALKAQQVSECSRCKAPGDVLLSGLCSECHQAQFEASQQIRDAERTLDLPADAYVRWPWPSLDEAYGGMGPSQLHYVVGFSGSGKTTFICSAVREWARAGIAVDVLPLEQKAGAFRAYLACQELNIPPGVMASGDFHRDFHRYAYQSADDMRHAVKAKMRTMQEGMFGESVRVHSTSSVSASAVQDAFERAAKRGAQVVVVDHIDHLGEDAGPDEYRAMLAANRRAHECAKDLGMTGALMSQGNLDQVRGRRDHLAKYAPPTDSTVYMGMEKRKLAAGMIGLFRPLRLRRPGEDKKAYLAALKDAKENTVEPQTVLMPCVTGVMQMKARHYGEREGRTTYLGWERGRTIELPLNTRREMEAAQQGIRT